MRKEIELEIQDLKAQINSLEDSFRDFGKEHQPGQVDFSILNNEDWFYFEDVNNYLIKGNARADYYRFFYDNVFSIKTNTLRRYESSDKKIKTLRKATPEDLKPLYAKHPELEEPKVGDLCIFFDDEEVSRKKLFGVGFLASKSEYVYICNTYRYHASEFDYAMKILPKWGYDEILKRYETFKKVML